MTQPITLASAQVRTRWGEIIDRARYTHQPYLITKKNQPAVIILGADDYEDMIDMMDTMAEQLDPEFQAGLIAGKKEIESGNGVSEEELDNILKAKMKSK